MSGHSKWTQIKRQKAVTDKKRGNLFTKLSNSISVAVKESGKDPGSNFRLRLAIDQARAANMPNENIERAIKRGAGELDGITIEEITYEAFGPGGVAIVIAATTDNRNRTTSEIRNILSKHQGSIGNPNSVLWMFQKKGVIRISSEKVLPPEECTLKIIDAGADDIEEEAEGITVYAQPEKLHQIQSQLESMGIKPDAVELELVAKDPLQISEVAIKNKLTSLFEELDSLDDVHNHFTNARY